MSENQSNDTGKAMGVDIKVNTDPGHEQMKVVAIALYQLHRKWVRDHPGVEPLQRVDHDGGILSVTLYGR